MSSSSSCSPYMRYYSPMVGSPCYSRYRSGSSSYVSSSSSSYASSSSSSGFETPDDDYEDPRDYLNFDAYDDDELEYMYQREKREHEREYDDEYDEQLMENRTRRRSRSLSNDSFRTFSRSRSSSCSPTLHYIDKRVFNYETEFPAL